MSQPGSTRLLLVEDDVGIGRMLERGLASEGYDVSWVRDLRTATTEFRGTNPQIIILDRMLPDGDGAALCSAVRKMGSDVPICMLTARETLDDKLQGFDAGADDYIVKPFEFDELTARLEVMLRRSSSSAATVQTPLLNHDRRTLELGGRRSSFTRREWPLICCFLEHENEEMTRERLIETVWADQDDVTSNSVDVYVGYVRRKLSAAEIPLRIETVRGVGFKLVRG